MTQEAEKSQLSWPSQTTSYQQIIIEWLGLGLLVLLLLDPRIVFDPSRVVGIQTRDLLDHLALLDQWSLSITEWAFPDGGMLVAPDIFAMLFAAPFMPLGRGIAFDLALWLQVWGVAIGGWYLGRRLGNRLLGALALVCSPYMFGQLLSGETETLNLGPLAMMLSYLLSKRPQDWKWAGLWASITAIGSWYYGAYAACIIAVWMMWRAKKGWQEKEYRVLLPAVGFLLLIAFPAGCYAWVLGQEDQMFRGPTMVEYMEFYPRALSSFSSDPLAWMGGKRIDIIHNDGLGWSITILACIALYQMWKGQDRRWIFLLCILLLGLLLSLGPILHIRGVPMWSAMPYRLFEWLPLFDLMRLPHRWMAVAAISLAALAAASSRHLQYFWGLIILFDGVIFYKPPRSSVAMQAPMITQLYRGPVLELPARTFTQDLRGFYLLWQREHRNPIAYSLLMQGWSSRIAKEPLVIAATAADRRSRIANKTIEARQFRLEEFALAVNIWRTTPDMTALQQAKQRLQAMGFQQVCFHKQFVHKDDAVLIQRTLEQALGLPSYEGEWGVLWQL